MKNIKRAVTVGITAFAVTACIPSNVWAANLGSINKLNEGKNVVSVNKACSLDEIREGLIQIAANGNCLKWDVIIGENNNLCSNNNTNIPNKPDKPSNPNKPEVPDNDIEDDTNEDNNGDNNEESKPDDNIDNNQPSNPNEPSNPNNPNNPNEPNTKPEDNNGQKPELPEAGEEEDTNSSYAQQVLKLVNIERAKEGLASLTWDQQTAKAAVVRAKEIQTSFSHTRPNGSQFATVLKENGVTYRGAGENIAWGQKTPEQVVTGWMNSPGHRANIMNRNFTSIGVGYVENSSSTPYWVQLFTY